MLKIWENNVPYYSSAIKAEAVLRLAWWKREGKRVRYPHKKKIFEINKAHILIQAFRYNIQSVLPNFNQGCCNIKYK